MLFLAIPSMSSSGDKIYTDEDLKAYSTQSSSSFMEPLIKTSDFNSSFDELRQYIEQKLRDIRIPEYQIYLHPLSREMTHEQVKGLWWGARTCGGMHEETLYEKSDNKTGPVDVYKYEIGIWLYFKNDRLKGWKMYDAPCFTVPKGTRKIDYKDLIKEPSYGEKHDLEIRDKTLPESKEKRYGEDERVVLRTWDCPTLGGETRSGLLETEILGHSRTKEEICGSVGRGCRGCVLVEAH